MEENKPATEEIIVKELAEGEKPSDEVEVKVVDPRPPEDRRPPLRDEKVDELLKEEDLGEVSEAVKKRVSRLTFLVHDQRRKAEEEARQKEAAIRYATAVREQMVEAQKRAYAGESAFVDVAKEKTKSELARVQQEHKAAFESGDADKVAQATEKLARLGAQAEQLETIRVEEPRDIPPPEPSRQIDHRALEWARDNPWFQLRDGVPQNPESAIAMGIHNSLVLSGVNPRTDPNYYETINQRLRAVMPDKFGEAAEKPVAEKAKTSAATEVRQPPTGIVGSAARGNTGPITVELTPSQVAIAKRLNVPLTEYARQQMLLKENKS